MRVQFGSLSVLSAAITLALAGPALAQAAQPGTTAGPRMGRHGFGAGLNLTEEQRSQIQTILQGQREAFGPQRKSLGELEQQLRAETFSDNPDPAKIQALQTEIASTQAALLASRVALQQQIGKVLTPEQRQKLRESRGQFGRFGGGHGRRGGRGHGAGKKP